MNPGVQVRWIQRSKGYIHPKQFEATVLSVSQTKFKIQYKEYGCTKERWVRLTAVEVMG